MTESMLEAYAPIILAQLFVWVFIPALYVFIVVWCHLARLRKIAEELAAIKRALVEYLNRH